MKNDKKKQKQKKGFGHSFFFVFEIISQSHVIN